MKDISLAGLIRSFGSRWAEESGYVGILVDIKGVKEVIINSRDNFDEKLAYYKNTYDKGLNHKYSEGVKIIDFTFGDTFAEIENSLLV